MTGVLLRERDTDREIKKACEDRGGDGSDVPRAGKCLEPQKVEGAETDTSPEPGGVWPSGHLAFRLLGPRTVREYIFALSCHQVWDNLLQQPQQTHTMIRKWDQSGDRGLAGIWGIGVTPSSDWG